MSVKIENKKKSLLDKAPNTVWILIIGAISWLLSIIIEWIDIRYYIGSHTITFFFLLFTLLVLSNSLRLFNKLHKENEKVEQQNKDYTEKLEEYIKKIEIMQQTGGALLTIADAVAIESEAKKEVYIISVDPTLELEDKFYNIVCHNLLRGIHYYYFFPNRDPLRMERAWQKMISRFREFKDEDNKKFRIDDALLKERLKIYIVEAIHIISNIVLVDPNEPTKTTNGWVFPIIENENLIVRVDETLTINACGLAKHWISQKEKFLKYPYHV